MPAPEGIEVGESQTPPQRDIWCSTSLWSKAAAWTIAFLLTILLSTPWIAMKMYNIMHGVDKVDSIAQKPKVTSYNGSVPE